MLAAYGFRAAPPIVVHLQHLASAMAVLLAQQNVRREHDRRIGAEVMASLCDGRMSDREGDRVLTERGLRPRRRAARRDRGRVGERRTAPAREPRPALGAAPAAAPRTLLYALMPVDRTGRSTCCAHRARRPRRRWVSATAVTHPRRGPAAVREATWAMRAAAPARRTAPRATATPRCCRCLRDTEEAQVVVDRVLGRLIAYDAAHSSDMVADPRRVSAVRSVLAARRRRRSGVHRQTVVYRIQRVEEITGRRIADTRDASPNSGWRCARGIY